MTLSSTLLVRGREANNIFQLFGDDENSISLAIAWAFTKAPAFLYRFLKRLSKQVKNEGEAQIFIQKPERGGGITDIEVVIPGNLHIIIEAKRGWTLPGLNQLERYANRNSFVESAASIKRLVTLSECSKLYAKALLSVAAVNSVPVTHIGWANIIEDARASEAQSSNVEKRLLRDLVAYLRLVMTGQRKDSNLVYVVSLSGHTEEGWKTSWLEVVSKYSRYFHPVGNRWPKDPPNYIAFRYYGQLQAIHHIDEYEVITNLNAACPGIPNLPVPPHYLYKLGPAIIPNHKVKNGKVYPSGRYWCALDTLLTCTSVSDARDQTQARGLTD